MVYASGSKPPLDPSGGWEIEEALDVEYAHAMAPNAKIYLVEANSSFYSDLFPAVLVANNLIACGQTTSCPSGSTGKGEVSMSWGGGEFSGEKSYDSFFTTPGVVYFAASGDVPGTSYPCVSQNVVCVGGTSTARQYTTGNFVNEYTWPEAGGGVSNYESSPPISPKWETIFNTEWPVILRPITPLNNSLTGGFPMLHWIPTRTPASGYMPKVPATVTPPGTYWVEQVWLRH